MVNLDLIEQNAEARKTRQAGLQEDFNFQQKMSEAYPQVEFREFTRKDFYEAVGKANTASLTSSIPQIKQTMVEMYGEEAAEDATGYQYDKNGAYHYTLEQIYKVIETCRRIEKDAKRKSKGKIVKKFRRHRAHILSVINQKGGSAKTSTSVHIAVAAAIKDFAECRVLLVDFDPQSGVHKYLDGRYINDQSDKTLFRYLMGGYDEFFDPDDVESRKAFVLNEIVRDSLIPNLKYTLSLSSDNEFEGFLTDLEKQDEGKYSGKSVVKLVKELFFDLMSEEFDLIVCDGAPHNNTFIKSLVYASEHIVIPAPTKAMDADSTIQFGREVFKHFKEFKELHGHPGLPYLDVLPQMYKTSDASNNVLHDYNSVFGIHVFPHQMHRRECYEKISEQSQTLYSYLPKDCDDAMTKALDDWNSFNQHLYKIYSKEAVV
uniref:ParA family protein n=1 Tax=Vibrio penaeicida TaxID=104609 RepID=UPI001CC6ACA6|nr:ParA family protein [Vibrio penaeicida]